MHLARGHTAALQWKNDVSQESDRRDGESLSQGGGPKSALVSHLTVAGVDDVDL